MFLQLLIALMFLLQLSCSLSQSTGSDLVNSKSNQNTVNTSPQIIQVKDKTGYDKYKKNRQLWESFNFKNYKLTAKVSEGGNINYANPLLIEVRENQIVSIAPDLNVGEGSINLFKQLETIEKIFNKISEGYEKDYEMKIKYDKKYGFPVYTYIHFYGGKTTDGWIIVEIKKFEPIINE